MKGRGLAFLGRALLRLRYRVRIEGLEDVLARGRSGILLLPNHPAYLDPAILLAHLLPVLRPRVLADRAQVSQPGLRLLTRRLDLLAIPDPAVRGRTVRAEVERAEAEIAADLARGRNILLYPSGRVYLGRFEDVGGNSAVEAILAQAPGARVVLARTTGLWGSSFSKAADPRPRLGRALLRGFGRLLANGLFFGPRREVKVVLEEPADLPRNAGRAALNRYLEAFYNRDAPPARYVPYTRWERGGARDLPEPPARRPGGSPGRVPPAIRDQVLAQLAERSGRSALPDSAFLDRDLGLDSLARLEVQIWIERQFGQAIADPEALRTVGDCLLAACGRAQAAPAPATPGSTPGYPERRSGRTPSPDRRLP